MNYELLKAIIDVQFSDWMTVMPHKMADGSEVCRVNMPLLEPNGDIITVYLMEKDGRFLVQDGGHIAGLLFELSCGKPNQNYWNILDRQLYQTGMKKNPVTGLVYVEADESSLRYWMTELAQLIAVLPHLLPELPTPPLYSASDKNSAVLPELPRIVREVSERLNEAGFGDAIQLNKTTLGQTGIRRRVDLACTIRRSGFGIGKEIYVLALDLNVKNPLEKVGRKLAVANDIAWSTPSHSGWKVGVRLVYRLRPGLWEDAPEARLLTAAGEKSDLDSYWWDDPIQQDKFISDVSKDRAAPER